MIISLQKNNYLGQIRCLSIFRFVLQGFEGTSKICMWAGEGVKMGNFVLVEFFYGPNLTSSPLLPV